jgi:porin
VLLSDQATYTIIDQMIWRAPGNDQWKGIGIFVLVMATPPGRNLLSVEVEAGVNFMGVWDSRPDDSFGVAFSYNRVSPSVSAFDRVSVSFSDFPVPVRDYEILFEVTYQAQIRPGFFVQPDFQYVFHLGGGVIDPLNPFVGRIPDAAVFGLRTVMKF